ncbi:MAG TPA: LCP family protein [Pseudonocardiaceae bacterium]|jgi:LCP family protein required for cell wall assembly|nr:LCP family protein [Pseudonocardiaceae bacterium]
MTDGGREPGYVVGMDDLLESTEDDETTVRRHRRWGRITLQITVALVALLVFGAVGLMWGVTNSVTGSVHTVHVDALAPAGGDTAGKPLTILLLGSDLRTGADTQDGSGVTGQRADAIMLIRFNADRSRIDVLSIPRDSWVPIPGKGTQKINASLGGGPSLVVRTVEQLTKIPIDHVMVMDFEGVRDLTDALGGVTVVNEHAITDPRNGNHFNAGPITLSGNQALLYVRIRYGLPNGDFDRIDHQQQVIAAISEKLRGENLLGKPGLLTQVVRIVASNLTVDSGLTPDLMTRTLTDIMTTPQSGMHFYTAPWTGFGTSKAGESYVNLNMPKLTAACQALLHDKPVPLPGTPINLP